MKLRLILTNFKCWDSKTIEFENGLTLINGTSGAGKTSILDALYFVFYKKGYKVIKLGKSTCSVTLIVDDVLVIKRTKRPEQLIWRENKDEYEDEVAQQYIYKRFGKHTDKLCYLKQDDINSFIHLKPAKKLTFIESILFKDLDMPKIKQNIKELQVIRHKNVNDVQSKIKVVENLISEQSLPECDFPFTPQSKLSLKNKGKFIQTFYKENDCLSSKIENLRSTLYNCKNELNSIKLKKLKRDQEKSNLVNCQKQLNELKFNAVDETKLKEMYILCKTQYDKALKQQERLQSKALIETQLDQSRIHYKKYKKETKQSEEKLNQYQSSGEYKKEMDKLLTYTLYKKDHNRKLNKIKKIREKLLNYQSINPFIVDEISNKIKNIQNKLKCETECLNCPKCKQALKYYESKLITVDESKMISSSQQEALQSEIKQYINDRNEIKNQLQEKQNLEHEFKLLHSETEKLSKKYNLTFELKEYETKIETLKSKLQKREQIERNYRYLFRSYKTYKEEVKNYKNRLETLNAKLGEFQIEDNISSLLTKLHSSQNDWNTFLQHKNRHKNMLEEKNRIETQLVHLNFKETKLKEIERQIDEKQNILNTTHKTYENRLKMKSKCEQWMDYYRRYQQLENHRIKLAQFKKHEKDMLFRLSGSLSFEKKIKYLSSYVLGKSINNLNILLEWYIKQLFPTKPIQVTMAAFKKKKDQSKPQINILIDHEYDMLPLLSGGERQRINIAMTFAMMEHFNLPFLLLDECTSNLDQELATRIVTMIKKKNFKKPIIMIAHQVIEGIFNHVRNIE